MPGSDASALGAIREAGHADIDAMRQILAGHGEDVPPTPGQPDLTGAYLRHLLDHHRVLVAVDGTAVLAFGAVVDTGRCLMLSDLYVRREHLGEGHGRQLLARLFGDVPRRATFASSDPRALPLYVRAGMTPTWVNLYLEGSVAALPATPVAFGVRDAGLEETTELERAWIGAHRQADHRFLGDLPAADVFVVENRGSPVAVGFARSKPTPGSRVLERLLVRPDVDPVGPIVAGLGRASEGGQVEACVPGTNPVLRLLLEARFRVVDQDQFLASHDDIVDPEHLLPHAGLL